MRHSHTCLQLWSAEQPTSQNNVAQEPMGFTRVMAICSPALRTCPLQNMEWLSARHDCQKDTWSHKNGCRKHTCPRQSCKGWKGLQDNDHVPLSGDDMYHYCKLTALPVLQCTPLAWPVQDATGGAGVVVGTGVVVGAFVCTLHTMPDHNACSHWQRRRVSG